IERRRKVGRQKCQRRQPQGDNAQNHGAPKPGSASVRQPATVTQRTQHLRSQVRPARPSRASIRERHNGQFRRHFVRIFGGSAGSSTGFARLHRTVPPISYSTSSSTPGVLTITMLFMDELSKLFATPEPPELGPGPRPDVWSADTVNQAVDKFCRVAKLPGGKAQLILALALLWHDHLEASHVLAQSVDTSDGAFVHGIMHRREPDYGNAA